MRSNAGEVQLLGWGFRYEGLLIKDYEMTAIHELTWVGEKELSVRFDDETTARLLICGFPVLNSRYISSIYELDTYVVTKLEITLRLKNVQDFFQRS